MFLGKLSPRLTAWTSSNKELKLNTLHIKFEKVLMVLIFFVGFTAHQHSISYRAPRARVTHMKHMLVWVRMGCTNSLDPFSCLYQSVQDQDHCINWHGISSAKRESAYFSCIVDVLWFPYLWWQYIWSWNIRHSYSCPLHGPHSH